VSVSHSDDVAPRRDTLPKVWGQVPPQNPYFTGRERLLTELRAAVMSGQRTAVLPHALRGMAGVGKTQLAVEFAYRNRSAYDVVWWIPADQPNLVQSRLAALSQYLGLPPATASGVEEAAGAVIDTLRRGHPFDKWLLIFDNANEPEDLNALIPQGGPGHVLITSRNHRWQGMSESIEVEVFSRSESVEFLTRRAPKAISSDAANELAVALGDLPLALEQAGALQRETGMPAGEYLEQLREHTRRMLDEGKPSDYPVSMTAAWRISVDLLAAAEPGALEMLRCCAFFGPDPIPRDVFRRGIRQTGSELSRVLGDPILLARAIRDLGRFALATIDSTNRTVTIHRLIQALIRDDLNADEQEKFRHEVHLLLAGATPADPRDEAQWRRFAELVPHLGPSQITESTEPELRDFALRMMYYLFRTGAFATARAFAEDCIRHWTADSGEDDPDVIAAERYLGAILRDSGEYHAAFELTGETLAKARRVLSPDSDVTLGLMSGYSADLRSQGAFTAGRDLDTELVRRLEQTLGPDDPETLRAQSNLALDLASVSDYPAARDLLHRTFAAQSQASQGVSRIDVLSTWSDLSRVLRLAGEYAEARLLAEDAYEFGRKELGPDHPWTLRTGKELSIAQRVAGEPIDEVADFARDILAQFERVLGDSHPETLAAATNLANSLRVAGHLDEAFEIARDLMDRYRQAYQPGHPYLYGCDGNVAVVTRLRGNPAAAREIDQTAFDALADRLGRDHDYPLTVALSLASDHAALGDVGSAVELGEDILPRLRAVLGADHPVTLGGAANLALDLAAGGDRDKAAQLTADTRERLRQVLGEEHPDAKAAAFGQRLEFDFDPAPF
jgi:tetratricopeptide (TPR) repeat protein